MKNYSNLLQRSDVRELFKNVVNRSVYNDIEIPIPLDNNYFLNNNYTLLLIMDALIKYDIIIEDDSYIEWYVKGLTAIIKKMNNYNDVIRGVNTLLIKYSAKVLDLELDKKSNKEKILRYIYQKYIVDGYFYYGFSNYHKKEIEEYGIRRNGFIIEDEIKEAADIFKKYENRDIIIRKNANLTDNFIVASYFSFIGPDFLEKLATSKIFDNNRYKNNFYYTKNIEQFKDNLFKYIESVRMSRNDMETLINDLFNVWYRNNLSTEHGCIAFIKRKAFDKNSLKDFEEIIKNSNDMELSLAVSMIMESRYTSYSIDSTVDINDIEIIDIPTFNDIIGNEKKYIKVLDEEDININKRLANSYGYATIIMFLGIILVSIGIIITFIVSFLGR